jgi:hypothetical protein
MAANREYKDSLFSWLFSDPRVLRELYGALRGLSLPPDIPIAVNTLEDVLFKARMNDISFVIGDRVVVLIEHQSTVNENMPLRLLLYITALYEKLTGEKDLYREKRIALPAPEFIVLYNGRAPYPDEKELRLSESFREGGGLWVGGEARLELKVRVYNINEGHNGEMVRRCKTLEGYSAFIGEVRGHEGEGKSRDEAIKLAVKGCIERNILREFLETHGKEVTDMLMTEWDWDDAKEVWFEEGWDEGREKGLEEGLEEGLERGREEIAVRLLGKGWSVEETAETSGLDLEKVRMLRSSLSREET